MDGYTDRTSSAAKRLVYGTIDIDMVAGPSEVLVIADESANPKKIGYIKQVWEGGYTDGKWKATRLLNGDETYHNAVLIAKGRRTLTSEKVNDYNADHTDEIFVYSPSSYQAIWSPGIYRVTTYLR